MIIFSILSLLLSNAVMLRRDLSILFNRIAIIGLIFCILQDMVSLSFINKGLGLHGGLLYITNITQIFHIFIFLISILVLQLTSFYFRLIVTPKDLLFNILNKYSDEYLNFLINNFFKYKDESFFGKIDIILSLLIIKIKNDTNHINCIFPFYLSFAFFLLFLYNDGLLFLYSYNECGSEVIITICLYLSFLFFLISFTVKFVHFIVKWNFFQDLNYINPFIGFIIKYFLIGLLLLLIIIIIMLIKNILIFFKENLLSKLKELKFNLDYEIRKGNKSPKNKNTDFFYLKKRKEKRKANNLKEKILEVQKNKNTSIIEEFSTNSVNISLNKTRNWTKTIEIPKVSEFTLESQIQKVEEEFKAYSIQEKKFKKIVIDINNNKENFYPNESKSLFNEYVNVVKLLKKNLKHIKKELKKVNK